MKTFTKGQKVRAIRDTQSFGGNADIGKGAVLEVSTEHGDQGELFNAWQPNGVDHYALAKDDFEPADATPAPLDPSKVKAGDTVAVHVSCEGCPDYDVTGEVYHYAQTLAVGPGDRLDDPRVTLTAHQPAPEPEPEWKPGEVALVRFPGGEGDRPNLPASYAQIDGPDGEWRALNGECADYATDVEVVRPLVVIDPAAVDWPALQGKISQRIPGERPFAVALGIIGIVAEALGIEATS